MKRLVIAGVGVSLLALISLRAQQQKQQNIDDFFRDFTAEWVCGNPNLATSSRYFTGEEQNNLERELTPETTAYKEARIQLAKKGLAGLAGFDKTGSAVPLTESQKLSADIM